MTSDAGKGFVDRSFLADDGTPAEMYERELQRAFDVIRRVQELRLSKRPKVVIVQVQWEDGHLDGCVVGDAPDVEELLLYTILQGRETDRRLKADDGPAH